MLNREKLGFLVHADPGVESVTQSMGDILGSETKIAETAAHTEEVIQLIVEKYDADQDAYLAVANLYALLDVLTPFLLADGPLLKRITHGDNTYPAELTPDETKLIEQGCKAADKLSFFAARVADNPRDPEDQTRYLSLSHTALLVETDFASHFGMERLALRAITNSAIVLRNRSLTEPDPIKRQDMLTAQVNKMNSTYEWARAMRLDPRLNPEFRDQVTLNFLANLLNSLGVLYLDLADATTDPEVIVSRLGEARFALKNAATHLTYLKVAAEDPEREKKQVNLAARTLAIQSNIAQTHIQEYYTQAGYNGKIRFHQLMADLERKGDLVEFFKPFLHNLPNAGAAAEPFKIEAPIRAARLVGIFVLARQSGDTLGDFYYDLESPMVNIVLQYLKDSQLSLRIGSADTNEPGVETAAPREKDVGPSQQALIAIIKALYAQAVQVAESEVLDTEDQKILKEAGEEFLEHGWIEAPAA